MKKLALLFACAAGTLAASAQLSLSGTSYTQNFDNIGSGLPAGWAVYTGATASSLGTDVSATNFVATPGSTTVWNSTTGNFRNVASGNGFATYSAGTAALQGTATDRALAVRQVTNTSTTFPGTDSGAAFVLQIANTTGLNNFALTFKLQSLDSTVARVTTWKVDYGFGATPSSFTQVVPTGTMTVGNNTYTNNAISVNFGSVLNNNAGPVWIRIVTLNVTTGSGSRATTGIDDFHLTWSGAATQSFRPVMMSHVPATNATGINPPTTNLQMVFDRTVTGKAAGNIYVKNETTQATQTIAGNASGVSVSGNTVTVSGVNIALGSVYHVTFDSAAFDTAGYKSYGLYDTTAWKFTASPAVVTLTSVNEGFDAACATSSLPLGWTRQSVAGPNQQWKCYTTTTTNPASTRVSMQMNGYAGTNNVNEDWLISPKVDLTAGTTGMVRFDEFKKFSGTELKVMVSSNYLGYGDPNAASWTDLNISMSASDTSVWKTYVKNLNSFTSAPFFVAFKYTSTSTDGYDVRVDSVVINSSTSVINTAKHNLDLTVLGDATTNNINLLFDLKQAGLYNLAVTDITGREVYRQTINANAGTQRFAVNGLNLSAGMYIIKLGNDASFGAAKVIVR
ncbi:choice-of-anchor J domain-containing protein [Chitinophagaceae bacterium MMS25-I14]